MPLSGNPDGIGAPATSSWWLGITGERNNTGSTDVGRGGGAFERAPKTYGETRDFANIMAEANAKPKPSIFKRIGNFFGSLFGRNKSVVEVGPVEQISEESFSKTDVSWSIIGALLFGNGDPYSAIGNAGVGPYAEERENVGMAAMLFINPEAAAEGLERKAISRAAMSKIWGAGLNYEWKTVLHPETLEKTIEKAWGKDAVGTFDNIIEQLASGKAGGNIHSLSRELKGFKAIDMPGTGTGRGAGRVIFKEASNQIEIIGVVKGHDYTKILK
ncbi:hypothetical protein [Chryseobacterium sp. PMSZPI]|uniref:hypothetical protein n=1 Tax=Chryseobacterium sp. PMSZPI TaxID=1033900 RepID=UPI000C33EECA|nr:hypothetical protein [Chryseobacterium sp. PMSZPI]PKF73284.1 hypothetical protein CW752_14755 [Chryseobacterium sp. PMSZPI]